MKGKIRHQAVLSLKRIFYMGRGEPYAIQGHRLRYVPGTRPTRLKYASSKTDLVARYDALQLRLISESLQEGDTALDIGAHSGEYAIIMAAICGPTGRVIAFEPDPYARRTLARNIKLNPNLNAPVIEKFAVSDDAGETVLYSCGGNSSLVQSGLRPSEKIPVNQITLDDYLGMEQHAEARVIKIDTEGAEIRVLKGAQRCLSGSSVIVCELHPYAWAGFGNSLDELKALVKASGRRIRYLDQDNEIGDKATYGVVVLER